MAQGYLNPIEQLQSSTWRELIAIERTLWSLVRNLSFKIIRLFTDNLAVAYVWLSGSRKEIIQKVVKRIFESCHERLIQLWIEWIPRKDNVWQMPCPSSMTVMIGCSTASTSGSWISCGDLTPLTDLLRQLTGIVCNSTADSGALALRGSMH